MEKHTLVRLTDDIFINPADVVAVYRSTEDSSIVALSTGVQVIVEASPGDIIQALGRWIRSA